MSPPNQVQSASLRHPSDETLLGLARNQLGSDETSVVQRHVWHCKRCQGILDEFRMENAPGDAVAVDNSSKAKIVSATTEVQGEESAKNLLASVPEELRNHSQYKVLRLIGQGGMGKVFLVEHKLTARKEVIKVVHPQLLAREDVRIRFQREIQAAAKLNHPNVVHTLTAIAEGSMIGLVMEYVKGENLFSIVNRVGPLPIERARDWIKQIAKGLNHAHQQNMVHRDLKPQNILVSKEGEDFRLRILDFGLAKTTGIAASGSELTLDGSIIGTPNYMAPEQAINPSLADIRSDLYSLGCIWFFLLTGRAPFESETPFAVMHAHQNHSPPSLRSFRTDVPIQSEQIISKLLAKAPGSRFQSPAELIDALSSSWSSPKVVVRSSPSRGNASASEVYLSEIVRKIPKKKTGRSYAGLLNAAMMLLPPAVLAGVLLSKPNWVPNLNSVLGLIDRGTGDSPPPGEASIVLNDLPEDAEIFIDDFPANFERPRADAMPRIAAKPGSYRLSVRRHDQKIYETTVKVQANEILKLKLGNLDHDSTQKNTESDENSSTASNRNSTPTIAESTEPPPVPGRTDSLPQNIETTSGRAPLQEQGKGGEDAGFGKKFVIQRRLLKHNSPILRVEFLNDGRLISAEQIGKPLLDQQKSVSTALHSSSQIIVWGKDGNHQSLPSEGTLADFLAAPNGNSICHIGRVFGSSLSIQLFREGRSLWKEDITTVGIDRGEMPYLAFSSDSNECLVAFPEGKFIRVNLRNGNPQPPVASLTSIDKSLVQSISVSQKLDIALFGLKSGEWLAVRTKDGRKIEKEATETEVPIEMGKPVVAAQFNSKDNRIATIDSDGVVCFSAFPGLAYQTELSLIQDGKIKVVGRSSNGRFLALINDRKRVSVLDLDEANVLTSWILSETDVGCAISTDNLGKQVAIGFESGSIAVFQQSREEW